MPELPDVMLYLDALRPRVTAQTIERLSIISPFVLRSVDPPIEDAEGRAVTDVTRLGKRVVLSLEGGHVAGLSVNGSEFPYIPQWIVIFILVLMFTVDLYQNWWERNVEQAPVVLHRRKK